MSELLGQLYPGLVDDASVATDPEALLRSVASKVEDSRETKRRFLDDCGSALVAMATRLADVFRSGGRLLTMGNGGSSCDAAHIAVEFNHPVTVGRRALPAVHLGGDVPMMTAVGNDVGFADVFARLVIAQGRPGDALLGLSTSGNSENLLRAFARAKKDGLVTLGMTGGDGGRMAEAAKLDACIVVASTSIHRVQECHVLAYHVLWDLVHTLLGGRA